MSVKQRKYTRFTVFSLLPVLLVAMAIAVPAFLYSDQQASALGTSDWAVVKTAVNAYLTGTQSGIGNDGEAGYVMTQADLKGRIDSDGDGQAAPTTNYLDEGDDAANAPVLVDNLWATANVIPGTSVRCNYNGAAATTSSCMNANRVDEVKARVDAHQAAGFSTDVVVYCQTGRTEAPTTGGFGIIANVSGGLATDTGLKPKVYGFNWGRQGWTNTSTFPASTVRTVGTPPAPSTTYSVSSSAAPDCSAETTDAGRVRCAAAWALDNTAGQGQVQNGVGASTGDTFASPNLGPVIDIRKPSPAGNAPISSTNAEMQITYDTLFNSNGTYLGVQTSTTKNVFVGRTSTVGGIAAMGARMLGYNATFLQEGASGWSSSQPGTWASTGVAYSTIAATASNVNSGVDQTAPTQSGIGSSDVTTTSAKISRTASEPATLKVEYGTTFGGPYTSTKNDTVLNSLKTVGPPDKRVSLENLNEYTTYYYVVTSYDGQANASTTSAEYSFTTLDDIPPVTTLTPAPPVGWTNVDYSGTLSCSDPQPGSGCAAGSPEYSINGGSWTAGTSINITTDGTYTIDYRSTDNSGNIESFNSATLQLDKTDPTTTATPTGTLGSNGWYTSDVTLNFNCTDTTSGCAAGSTEYSTNGGVDWTTGSSLVVSNEGTNNIYFRSKDNANNAEGDKLATVKVDKTAPVTTDDAPSGWQTSPFTVNFTCTDSVSGCDITEYSLNNGSTWTPDTTPLNFSTDGTYTIKYRSSDLAGNQEPDPYATVQLDQTDPSTTATPSGTLGSNGWYTSDVTLNFNCTDTTSGCAAGSTEYSTNGGVDWTTGSSLVVSNEGTNNIYFRSKDNANNAEGDKLATVKVDKTDPVTTDDAPSGWQTSPFTVNFTCTDSVSGCDITEYSLNNGSTWTPDTTPLNFSTDGTYTIKYRSSDLAGNQEPDPYATVQLDQTDPSVTSVNPSGTINYDNPTITASYSDAISGIDTSSVSVVLKDSSLTTMPTSCTPLASSVSCTTSGLADDAYTIEASVSDNAGNTKTANGSFSINTSAPTVTPDPAIADYQDGGGNYWSDGNIPYLGAYITDVPTGQNISSAGVDVDSSPCSGTVNFTNWYMTCWPVTLSEGARSLNYWAEYSTGNPGSSGPWILNVDTTAPTTTDDAPAGWQASDVTVNLTCNDGSGSGCAGTLYRVNLGSGNSGNSFTITTQGNNNLDYYSNDNVDNSESPIQSTVVQIDKSDPVTTDDAPSGWQTHPFTVTFSCSDSVSDCDYTEYSLDDGGNWTTAGSANFSTDGVYTIKYRSTDLAGNQEPDPYATVQLDQTDPQTTDDAPAGWQASDVTVNLSCSDATSGCAWTKYSTDGGVNWTTANSVVVSSEGINAIAYYSADIAGNIEDVKVANVQIDKTAPATTDNAPAGWQASDITVNFNCTDALSGCADTYSRVDSGSGYGSWQSGSLVLISTDGTNTIQYYSVDAVGNTESPVKSTTVQLDKTGPTAGAIYMLGESGDWTESAAPTLAFNIYDSLSGINSSTITGYVVASPQQTLACTSTPISGGYHVECPTTGAGLTDGDFTAGIEMSDSVGNAGSGTRLFHIDTTPPSIDNLLPSGEVSTPTVSLSADLDDDPGSGIDGSSVKVYLDGSITPVPGCVVNATSVACPPVPVAVGPHTFEVEAKDNVGNTASNDTGSFERTQLNFYFAWYDYGSSNTGLFLFNPVTDPPYLPEQAWNSGPGNWDFSRSRTTVADRNNDGRTELNAFYDYGNNTAGLFVFDPISASGYEPLWKWTSCAGCWDFTRFKVVTAADQLGADVTQLSVLYNYGNANTGLFVFNPETGTENRVWLSGAGNWDWNRSKILTAANYDGDATIELAVLYEYGNSNTGIFVFDPDEWNAPGYLPERVWLSGPGNLRLSHAKITVADQNNDGRGDIALLYDYGDATSGLFVFDSGQWSTPGYMPSRVWYSDPGNWDWSRSIILSGADQDGDGLTELAMLYDYGSATTALYQLDPVDEYKPDIKWNSGPGNWDGSLTKPI